MKLPSEIGTSSDIGLPTHKQSISSLNKNAIEISESTSQTNEPQKRKNTLRLTKNPISVEEAASTINDLAMDIKTAESHQELDNKTELEKLIPPDQDHTTDQPMPELSEIQEATLFENAFPQNIRINEVVSKSPRITNNRSLTALKAKIKGYIDQISLYVSKTYNLCFLAFFLSAFININRLDGLRDVYFLLTAQTTFLTYFVLKRVLFRQKSLFEESLLFFIFFIGLNQLMNMADLEFKEWFYYNLTSSTLANFSAFLIIVGIELHLLAGIFFGIYSSIKKIWEPKPGSEPKSSMIPAPPDFTEELCITVGEVHCPETGKRQKKATLITIPEKGLYTNLFVFGSIGSGKTVFLLSILQQILSYKKHTKELKPCGLFIDEKGNLGSQVLEIAKGIGREDDVYVFDLSGKVIWNVIHEPSKGADAIARRLEKIMESSVEKSADWIRKYAYEFLVNIIKLIRLTSPEYYITLKDIHEHIHDEEKIKSKLKILNQEKYEIIEDLANKDTDIRQIKNIDLKYYIDEEYKIIHTYFTKSWFLLKGKDPEVFGYISTSLSQLVGPVIDPKIAYIFNPDHPSKINFKGFDWIINEGKLFVYSVPDSIYEGLGKYIAMFMKLPFQNTCLSRIPKTTKGTEVYDPNYNKDRPILFVADENQNSYHPSDNNSIDKLREAKVIHICLSQTFVSLLAQKHNEAGVLQYLGSFRNKLFLSTDDPKSAEYYSKIVGQELRKNKSVSYSESSKDASVNILQNSVVNSETNLSKSVNFQDRLESRFDYTKFIDLKMFQGIFTGFGGNMKIAAQYVYVKPYWVNWKKDYFTYIKEM